ncbi:MAG: hypothetical protein IPK50_16495 [Fibrobacterota bacterium]|nr:MAG: hypothetical protein IPK50_16495 [Fibrobacterota bacterium]
MPLQFAVRTKELTSSQVDCDDLCDRFHFPCETGENSDGLIVIFDEYDYPGLPSAYSRYAKQAGHSLISPRDVLMISDEFAKQSVVDLYKRFDLDISRALDIDLTADDAFELIPRSMRENIEEYWKSLCLTDTSLSEKQKVIPCSQDFSQLHIWMRFMGRFESNKKSDFSALIQHFVSITTESFSYYRNDRAIWRQDHEIRLFDLSDIDSITPSYLGESRYTCYQFDSTNVQETRSGQQRPQSL